jgi:hypothetical protein
MRLNSETRLSLIADNLDPAGFAAAADQNLGFDDNRKACLAGDLKASSDVWATSPSATGMPYSANKFLARYSWIFISVIE